MPIGGESDVTWPSIDDLRQIADVPEGHDAILEAVLAAAIDETKAKRGNWDELADAPDEALAASALMRAFELVSDQYIPLGERKSDDLLVGKRERFPLA